jgi:hypothetical protein
VYEIIENSGIFKYVVVRTATAVPNSQRSKCKNGIVLQDAGIQLRQELNLDHKHFI